MQARIDEAQLDVLPVPEAIARVTRGFVATGSKYIALAYLLPKPDAASREVSEPLLRLFGRGIRDGTLRGDLPAETLLGIYTDLIEGGIARSARARTGVEEASAAILAVFLDGAARPQHAGSLGGAARP